MGARLGALFYTFELDWSTHTHTHLR